MGKVYTLYFGEGVFTQYLESKSRFNHINLRDAEFLNLEEAKWTRKHIIESSNGKIAEDQVGIVAVDFQFIPAEEINKLK
jgi:hypothetical protein